MQRLFKVIGLRIDLSPVKRPLMEGSVWYDLGKVKVTLISGLCGNSREDVETRLRTRAELLVAEFLSGRKDPLKSERDASSVSKLIQNEIGKTLPQLLNHLDIQLHIKFGLDTDVVHMHPPPLSGETAEMGQAEKGVTAPAMNDNETVDHPKDGNTGSGRFRCSIYAREVWETQMEWTKMASVTQEEVEHLVKDFPSGNSLLIALKKAAGTVEDVLLRKREDHYFESMREAELMLRHLPQSEALDYYGPTSFLKPQQLTSSVLQSSRGAALLLKVTLKDEMENETACALPLAGGCYALVGEKMHLSSQFQYSCIHSDEDVEEVPLISPPSVSHDSVSGGAGVNTRNAFGIPAPSKAVSTANVQSSTLPPPQKALRLLAALLPSLWYFLSNLCQQEDVHEWAARKSAVPTGGRLDSAVESEVASLWMMQFEMKRGFMSAAVFHAGSAIHAEWWEAYNAARGWPASAPAWCYVHLCASAKTALDRAEEKVSSILGWRFAPVLHVLHRASLIAFAVSDSKKRVFALGTVFESVDDFANAVSGSDEVVSTGRRKSSISEGNMYGETTDIESDEAGQATHHHHSSSLAAPHNNALACNMDIISVEETLRALGVTAGEFDPTTSTLVLTMGESNREQGGARKEEAESKGESTSSNPHGTRTLTFSQLNETAGIARLFRFCQKTARRKVIYQTIRMDTAGSTYCRRAQRLLALVFRKGQFNKPGLRGKLLPIPVPFTSKFLVLPFTSILQREVFSMQLLMAMEPFCRTPSDYPTFQWPLFPLPTPCFFNYWGPTKKLLQRLGPYYYCSISTSVPELRGSVPAAEGATSPKEEEDIKEGKHHDVSTEGKPSFTVDNTNSTDEGGRSGGEGDGPIFTLLLFSGDKFVDGKALAQRIPLRSCRRASELPIVVLLTLDRLVCEETRSAHSKKTQQDRMQKMLCDRGVPREITLSQPQYWPKVIRLLYDSQEYYVRHANQYKLLLEISPTIKTVELATMDVPEGAIDDSVWKNTLATKYAEACLLPLLEPVALLYNRGLRLLEKIPPPKDAKVLKFFSINIRSDVKQNNFHGSLSAGSSSFRKDTIQGLPSSTPTAALESLLKEIEETADTVLMALGQRVHTEITSGISSQNVSMASSAPSSTNGSTEDPLGGATSSKLICSLEVSAAQKTLSPYLTDVQTVVKLKMDLKEVVHQYHWDTHRLVLLGTPNVPGESPIEIASRVCTWDEIPIVLPQLYARVTNKELSKHFRKSATELERAMTKGAVAMLEHEVRSRLVPVMGTEKLYQNIRVVQVLGESMWYAEIRLPRGLFKVDCVGEPTNSSSPPAVNVPAGAVSPALVPPRIKGFEVDLDSFHVSCSTNTKRGALRKILVEFYMLYVAGSDAKISLFGGRAPSTASAENNKKLPVTKVEKPKGGESSLPGTPGFRGPSHFPAFMRLPKKGAGYPSTPSTPLSTSTPSNRPGNPLSETRDERRGGKNPMPQRSVNPSMAASEGSGATHGTSGSVSATLSQSNQPQPRKVLGGIRAGSGSAQRDRGGDQDSMGNAKEKSSVHKNGHASVGAQPRKAAGVGSVNRPLRQEIQPRVVGEESSTCRHHNNNDHETNAHGNHKRPESNIHNTAFASRGELPKPRKVSRATRSARATERESALEESKGETQTGSSTASHHQNLYVAMMTLLEREMSHGGKCCTCEMQLSHRHGARLLLCHSTASHGRNDGSTIISAPSNDNPSTPRGTTLLSQSVWNSSMWPPKQLLHFLLSCVCREVSGPWGITDPSTSENSSGGAGEGGCHAKLRELCASLRPPNTVLTPTMPAKQFCVFFFHRYFGWQACDAEDVLHMNGGSPSGPCGKQNAHMMIIADCEAQEGKQQTTWMGHIKLAQLRPSATEFLFFTVLASSDAVEDREDALNQAWESCMMHIITTFGFDHQTNIYQHQSLDESVIRSLVNDSR